MDSKDEAENFLEYLLSERGFSKNTVSAYRRNLNLFFDHLARNEVDLDDVSEEVMEKFLIKLKRKNLSASSRSQLLSSIRSFYRYLVVYRSYDKDPSELVGFPKVKRKLPDVLTVKEVMAMLDTPTGEAPLALRDKAMLEFMYATGLRVSELLSLNIWDLDFDERIVRVIGKGSKERLIPFGEKAKEATLRYIKDARPLLLEKKKKGTRSSKLPFLRKESEVLFLNKNGEPLTRVGFWKILKNYARKAGVKRNVTPHTLRHSFATHMLQAGCDLRTLQALLGHASLSTTEVYTHLDIAHLKEAHSRFHPRG